MSDHTHHSTGQRNHLRENHSLNAYLLLSFFFFFGRTVSLHSLYGRSNGFSIRALALSSHDHILYLNMKHSS